MDDDDVQPGDGVVKRVDVNSLLTNEQTLVHRHRMDLVSYTGMASACSPLSKLTDTAVNDGHVLYNVVIDNHHNLVGLEQAHDLHNKAVSIPHNVEPFLGKIAGHLTMLLDLQFVAIFLFSILITSLARLS